LQEIKERWCNAFSKQKFGEFLLKVYGEKSLFRLWHELDENLICNLFSDKSFSYLLPNFFEFGEKNRSLDYSGVLDTPSTETGELPMNLLIDTNPEIALQILLDEQAIKFIKLSDISCKFNLKKMRFNIKIKNGEKKIVANELYYLKRFIQSNHMHIAHKYFKYLKLHRYPNLPAIQDIECQMDPPNEIEALCIFANSIFEKDFIKSFDSIDFKVIDIKIPKNKNDIRKSSRVKIILSFLSSF